MTKEVKEDFLEVDDPIGGQNYVCLSFVDPEEIIQNKEAFKTAKFLQSYAKDKGMKFDEVYEDYLNFQYKFCYKNAAATKIKAFWIDAVIENFSKSVSENNKIKFSKFVVPVHPYKIDIPNKSKAEENEPKIKYFKPASVEKDEFFLDAAKTYKHKLCISIAKYNEIKS